MFNPSYPVTDGMGLEGCIAQTASGGIPARSGAVAGKAEDVAMQQIGADGTLIATGSTMTVYNLFSIPISGSVYILCKRVDGVWIVDEDTETNKSWILQTPAGGIPARSGTSAGSASCTPYYIDSSGSIAEQLDDSNASQTFTVYNVSASAVSGSAYIQAKNVKGKLVVDMEDCG